MKVSVTNIEHVSWAKRLIIDFQVELAASDSSKGGWVYLLNKCGYKGVCDEDWIVMDPNWQHPKHSDTIVAPGKNTFVWDYGGVHGLDPKAFDAEHSYVVQIALIDSSCNWVDPCENSTWVTPDTAPIGGIKPDGTPGEQGNCGPGWLIEKDAAGCLKCTKEDGTGPIVPGPVTPGPDGVTVRPWGSPGPGAGPPGPGPGGKGPRPTAPGGGGGGGGDGGPIPTDPGGGGVGGGVSPLPPLPPKPPKLPDTPVPTTPGDNTGPATPWNPPPPVPGLPQTPGATPDSIPGGGVGGVGGGGGDDGQLPRPSGGSCSGGLIDMDRLKDPYGDDTIDGLNYEDQDTTYLGEGWIGHDQGGREASFEDRTKVNTDMNAELSQEMLFYTAGSFITEPNKNLGMDMQPKQIPTSSKEGINDNPGGSKPKRSTKIEDAIVTNNMGDISIKGRDSDSSVDNIVTQNSLNNSSSNTERSNPDFQAFSKKNRNRAVGDSKRQLKLKGISTPSDRTSVGRRTRGEGVRKLTPEIRKTGHVVAFRNEADFHGNYVLQMVSSPIGNGMVFVDSRVDIKPRVKKTIRLRIYLMQGKRSKLAAETQLKEAAHPRVISSSFSTEGFVPGKSISVMSTVDDGTNILGRAVDTFTLIDYGATQAGGSYVPQGKGAHKQAIENMIQSRESLSLVVTSKQQKIIVQTINNSSERIELGAYTKVGSQNAEQRLTFYNQVSASLIGADNFTDQYLGFNESPLVDNIGKLEIKGLDVVDSKYAGAAWNDIDMSGVSGTGEFMLLVSNSKSNSDTRTELYVGKDLQIKPMRLDRTFFTGTGGTYSVSLETPYANESLTIYEAGGNSIVPTAPVEQTFTTDLAGDASLSITFASLPTWFAVARAGSDNLAERTITWFQAKP